jgi:hypothetical protein
MEAKITVSHMYLFHHTKVLSHEETFRDVSEFIHIANEGQRYEM